MEKVYIIGGGVSGLVASIFASENNDVTILERNSNCGKKILSTGNGKCNYTNTDQDLKHYHSSNEDLIKEIITNDNINKINSFYKKIGIISKIKNGYCYPYSNQAVTFQNALIKEAKDKNVKIITDTYVEKIKKEDNKYIIITENKKYIADKIIIATGSKAFSKSGSDGNGYDKLKEFGHKIIKPLPALVQLKTMENLKKCSGVRSEVEIKLFENNEYIKKEIGEIQFTDYGISGICAMQLSGFISRSLDNKNKINVSINFIPDISNNKESFIEWMNNQNKLIKNRTITEHLDNILNYKITNFILSNIDIDGNKTWEQLNDLQKEKIANSIIDFELNIIGTNSFEQAQVCTGGIPLNEINTKTMESLKNKNLYIVGELLDVDGDCGGYNITFASITGMLAGMVKND